MICAAWEGFSRELHAKGYNHTDSDRFARPLAGKRRGLAWARIVRDSEGVPCGIVEAS